MQVQFRDMTHFAFSPWISSMKKFTLSSGFGSLFWPSSPASISSLVLLSSWCRPWECFFCVAASLPLKKMMLTSLLSDAPSVIGCSSTSYPRIWTRWFSPTLWANWPKNSNMEVNSLAMSVNPLQWWADLFIVFHFIFFRSSLFFSNQVLECMSKFFQTVVSNGNSYIFFIFFKNFSLWDL